jgi:3-phenylpropionate/trans-cinnamate dioxygenase ferredoxin reductase component
VADRAVGALIVGGGPAGAACAEALYEGGFGSEILLVGREFDAPYERPVASKGFLAGAQDRGAALLHDAAWYAKRSIELATGVSVMRLDTAARTATLSTKEVVEYGVALIATGANVRRLRVDGAQLGGIHYLRTLGTADTIRAEAAEAERVVLIGGSYIACEVAATLTTQGKRCTMVMLEDAPLATHFGGAAGAFFGTLLRDHGVELVTADGLERFEGSGERVERVVTASGRAVDADMVVMGTGVMPDVMLARSAKLELGESGGVACASDLETSARGVFAAGDMCEYDSVLHGGPARIEHYEVAVTQGKAAAAAMLGTRRPFSELPYFWTDLADWATAEWVGVTEAPEREIVRGSVADGAFSVLHVAGGRLVAAMSVERGEDLAAARRLIADRVDVGERLDELAHGDLEAL